MWGRRMLGGGGQRRAQDWWPSAGLRGAGGTPPRWDPSQAGGTECCLAQLHVPAAGSAPSLLRVGVGWEDSRAAGRPVWGPQHC